MCKKFLKNVNRKIKRMDYWDLAMLKIAVGGFALLIAKLWSPILNLEWYWYGLIFILPYIILAKRINLLDLFIK